MKAPVIIGVDLAAGPDKTVVVLHCGVCSRSAQFIAGMKIDRYECSVVDCPHRPLLTAAPGDRAPREHL